ncbi:MAG TPA: thiamine pyrophosphate-dependent enzyme [Opitutaceae bacterium]|nr:thiamine pyrophosphate-dependent enzyme [Opitutaceae bacterium]
MTAKKAPATRSESSALRPAASALDAATKLRLLRLMIESRQGDFRQESLNRQGRGHFHVASMGHEALAAVGLLLGEGDFACPYYRDRALVLARGVSSYDLALEYFGKRESSSGGRQLTGHFSSRPHNIWSVPTPTAAQMLPACGIAWGLQMDGKPNVVVTSSGDAATRQGDFYEALCFAQERTLPVLMLVQDNAYGISTPTRKTNPYALGVLAREQWQVVDGSDVLAVHAAAAAALARLRAGEGPAMLWIHTERLASHTSSDDHKLYRSAEDLERIAGRDPLSVFKQQLLAEGLLTEEAFAKLEAEVRDEVRAAYDRAEKAEDPRPEETELNVFAARTPELGGELFPAGKYRIGDLVNQTLRAGLKAEPRRLIFGEDVEDPKGGVFRLTRTLSTDFPGRVVNSPLAESTILGVACGLASYGWKPVFEIQFIDFICAGWNQLATNLATLRWRTNGQWTCPAVIYAPYGAYLPGGSLWHSQTNESLFAHLPGLHVVVPSTPADAAGLLWTAMHAEDPVLFLVPKHMFWAERESTQPVVPVPFGQARLCREGADVTLVAWGNTVELCEHALETLGDELSVELIDLRTIVPWDRETIAESVRKTGRLVVVQEDTVNCSVGQMIVTELSERPEVFSRMICPPVLVSKGNVMIGFNAVSEYAALPDAARVLAALRQTMTAALTRATVTPPSRAFVPVAPAAAPAAGTAPEKVAGEPLKVPIMGEGIRDARVVSLLKQPGDPVQPDEALCEVETEKAVYPIEAAQAGTFVGWRTKIDDTVLVGQVIGVLAPAGVDWRTVSLEAAGDSAATGRASKPGRSSVADIPVQLPPSPPPEQAAIAKRVGLAGVVSLDELGAPPGAVPREPVLAPAISQRLAPVVPATIELAIDWSAIRAARQIAKLRDAAGAPSPSSMVAWAVTQVMVINPSFRRLVLKGSHIVEVEDFELGVAVALEGDRLVTAVIPQANRLTWDEFHATYVRVIDEARRGKIVEVRAPLMISSLGSFGVRAAIPIVVPPAMSTLFIGTSHHEMIRNGNSYKATEVVTMALTFDHRVVNGGGAAMFMQDLRKAMETFQLPAMD